MGRSSSLAKSPRSNLIKAAPKKAKPPPEPKSFDQRTTKRGDGSEKTTFAAVGLALSRWTQFELNLARLFGTFVATSERSMVGSMLAFGAVRTFEGRLEMLKSAGAWFFAAQTTASHAHADDPKCGPDATAKLRARYDNLVKFAGQFVGRRNEIAHGIVSQKNLAKVGKNKYIHLVRPRFALQPAYIELSKHNLFRDPKFLYGSKELLYFAGEFEKLAIEAAGLNENVHDLLKRILERLPNK